MPKLKELKGTEVVRILQKYGFINTRTRGSHIRMSLKTELTSFHITIPNHVPLKKGTLHGIVKDFESIFGIQEAQNAFYN